MVQEGLYNEEDGEFLDQRLHMITTTEELQHRTRKFMRMVGDYLVSEGPLIRAMATWTCHINRFERQYDKAFSGNPFFGAYLINRIHKPVKVFLYLCNTTSLKDVEMGSL